MEIEESILQQEVNKIRRKGEGKKLGTPNYPNNNPNEAPPDELLETEYFGDTKPKPETFNFDAEEARLLVLLIKYGNILITTRAEDEYDVEYDLEITLGEFIIFELYRDGIAFENPLYTAVLDEYIEELEAHRLPDVQHFLRSPDPLISSFAINYVLDKHEVSPKWINFGVIVPKEINQAKRDAIKTLFSFKSRKLNSYIVQIRETLKTISYEESIETLEEIKRLDALKGRVNKLLGREVIK
jgi:hypothetical protein